MYYAILRDVRRLVVALSRARLGLYILGCVPLFNRCYELRQSFRLLLRKPTQLELLPNETFDMENRRLADEPPTTQCVQIVDTVHMSHFVAEFYKSNIELLKLRHLETVDQETMEIDQTEPTEPKVGIALLTLPLINCLFINLQICFTLTLQEPASNGIQGQNTSTTTEAAEKEQQKTGATAGEHTETPIVFEQIDFERLQEIPKY